MEIGKQIIFTILLGNASEWTQEIYNSGYYMRRDGDYYNDGSTHPLITRWSTVATYANIQIGFRTSLYKK